MSRLIEGYIREAFEKRDISEAQSKELWQYYYKHLNKALAEGYNPTIEETNTELVTSLKHNLARFSAFKETSFKQQIEASLTKNGKVLSWQEFKAEANKLNIEYNRRWLQTEYNQTVANALSAQKYEEYIANKRVYPNLTYHTVHDERTRETHRAWDGLTLPVEHSFWKTHLPPNDWGCRCYVEPTADPVTEGVRTEDIPIKEAFANNPALSGEIFPIIPYAKGMSEKAVKEVEKQVEKRLGKQEKQEKHYQDNYNHYLKLKKDSNYTDVVFNENNGGLKATHRLHSFDPNRGHYEKEVRDILFNNGDRIVLEKELVEAGQKHIEGIKQIDGYFYDYSCDISTILGTGKNTIKRAFNHSKDKKAEVAILYFPNKEDFSLDRIKEGVKKYEGQTNYRFKKIVYIVDKEVKYY